MTAEQEEPDRPVADAAEVVAESSEIAESGEVVVESEQPLQTTDPKVRGTRRGARVVWLIFSRIIPVTLAVMAVASAGLALWIFYRQYSPNRATDETVARAVVDAASAGSVAVLSYGSETLDADFTAAKSHLTGEFLSYYDQLAQDIVAPAARQKSLKASAVVLRAAVSELHPDSAVVLVFANQSTTAADRPEPKVSVSCISVTLTKQDGAWLISKFDPV